MSPLPTWRCGTVIEDETCGATNAVTYTVCGMCGESAGNLDADGLPLRPVQHPGWPEREDMTLYASPNSSGTMYPAHWTYEERAAYVLAQGRAVGGHGNDIKSAAYYARDGDGRLPQPWKSPRDEEVAIATRAAALSVACPTCGAAPDHACPDLERQHLARYAVAGGREISESIRGRREARA